MITWNGNLCQKKYTKVKTMLVSVMHEEGEVPFEEGQYVPSDVQIYKTSLYIRVYIILIIRSFSPDFSLSQYRVTPPRN